MPPRATTLLSPFAGPVVAALALASLQLFRGTGCELPAPIPFFIASSILNAVFALPLLLLIERLGCRWLDVLPPLGAGAVAFPALLLSTPLFAFDPLPERGYYLLPLVLFVSLGAMAGAVFAVGVRRLGRQGINRAGKA